MPIPSSEFLQNGSGSLSASPGGDNVNLLVLSNYYLSVAGSINLLGPCFITQSALSINSLAVNGWFDVANGSIASVGALSGSGWTLVQNSTLSVNTAASTNTIWMQNGHLNLRGDTTNMLATIVMEDAKSNICIQDLAGVVSEKYVRSTGSLDLLGSNGAVLDHLKAYVPQGMSVAARETTFGGGIPGVLLTVT